MKSQGVNWLLMIGLLLALFLLFQVATGAPQPPTPTPETFLDPENDTIEVSVMHYVTLIRYSAVQWCVAEGVLSQQEDPAEFMKQCLVEQFNGACRFYMDAVAPRYTQFCVEGYITPPSRPIIPPAAMIRPPVQPST